MTARTGTGSVNMVLGVTPEDLEIAQKLVSTSPGYLSKWTKSELVSAAVALRLFVRELPGGPKLLRRAVDLARSTNGGEDERMARAVKAISRQEGVDASLYRPTQAVEGAAATTSTQAAGGSNVNWADLSQIPSNQGSAATAGTSDETILGDLSNVTGRTLSSSSAPTLNPAPSHVSAAVVAGGEGDAGAASAGVRGAAGANVLDEQDGQEGDLPSPRQQQQQHQQNTKKKGVCSYSWRRKPCAKSNGCQYQHPALCYNPACVDGRTKGCSKFHGSQAARMKEEGRHNRTRKSQGNGGRGDRRSPYNNGNNNRRNSNSTVDKSMVELCKARERVAKLQLQLQLSKAKAPRSGAPPPSSTGSTDHPTWANVASGNSRHSPTPIPTSAHVRHSNDLAEIIARAVTAALRGALV